MPTGRPLRFGARLAVPALVVLSCLAAAAPALAQDEECDLPPSDPSLDFAVCLLDRFLVELQWKEFAGNPFAPIPDDLFERPAQAVVLTPSSPTAPRDTGYFWFFTEDNIELGVRMVDGRSINGAFWFFAGSVTNVEYRITVTDTSTGAARVYLNPAGTFMNHDDVEAFPEIAPQAGGGPVSAAALAASPAIVRHLSIRPAGSLPSCADPAVACVQDGRFALQTTFDPPTPSPPASLGLPALTTETSALFGRSSVDDVVQAVKVLDGRDVNGSFWLFSSLFAINNGDLVTLTVTDLETGKTTSYTADTQPPGEDLVIADRQPFAPDPPDGPWLETAELPGFRFKVRVTAGGDVIPTRQEADCIPETLCISGAVAGRSELFLRIVGPKPNGFLQPNVVKFSTSEIEVWIEQLATGLINYYLLDGASPGSSDLTGFFDRFGFGPGP